MYDKCDPAPARAPGRIAWLVLAVVSLANSGNFYVYDSIGPVADLLQRQRGFNDTPIGWLNAIYGQPNVVLLLLGGRMVDRFGAGFAGMAAAALTVPGHNIRNICGLERYSNVMNVMSRHHLN